MPFPSARRKPYEMGLGDTEKTSYYNVSDVYVDSAGTRRLAANATLLTHMLHPQVEDRYLEGQKRSKKPSTIVGLRSGGHRSGRYGQNTLPIQNSTLMTGNTLLGE